MPELDSKNTESIMAWRLPFALLTLLAGSAAAHGGLANYTVGDTWYRGYDPSTPNQDQEGQSWMVQRIWASIDPVFSVNEKAMACNAPATAPPSYIPITAGETLTAVYWYWLHPVGPMSVWLAACGETCDDVDVNDLDFFKIWEAGILSGTLLEGLWYQKNFQTWDGSPNLWPVTIPAAIKPGLYVVRHEILSIHVADKPQFYPECAHLNITGTGTALPSSEYLAKFPGAYDANDPSIKIDIYADAIKDLTNYTVAGPPVWDERLPVNKYCKDC
ncbi:glycoside hydrolase family 61 protein [Xylariomycetidae sp. FL2044]|nr:glycoside hydrolase family 61 protein [Xylariomycetidae sp. FL2044]